MEPDNVYSPRIRRRRQQAVQHDRQRFDGNSENFYSDRFDDDEEEPENENHEFNNGYDKGFDEGYRDGYNDGYADHEYNSRSIGTGHPEDLRWHKRKSWSWYWV